MNSACTFSLKRNKFQKTHILKVECLLPTISYTFSDFISVLGWNFPVYLGICVSTAKPEIWVSWTSAQILWPLKGTRAALPVWWDCRLVTRMGASTGCLLVGSSRWWGFLSVVKPVAGGFSPQWGTENQYSPAVALRAGFPLGGHLWRQKMTFLKAQSKVGLITERLQTLNIKMIETKEQPCVCWNVLNRETAR